MFVNHFRIVIFNHFLQVQTALQKIDSSREYSKRTIFQSEIYVYKAVEFEMPQCTPKDCVDVLLAATGLRNTPGILDASKRLVDLSYLCVCIILSNAS